LARGYARSLLTNRNRNRGNGFRTPAGGIRASISSTDTVVHVQGHSGGLAPAELTFAREPTRLPLPSLRVGKLNQIEGDPSCRWFVGRIDQRSGVARHLGAT